MRGSDCKPSSPRSARMFAADQGWTMTNTERTSGKLFRRLHEPHLRGTSLRLFHLFPPSSSAIHPSNTKPRLCSPYRDKTVVLKTGRKQQSRTQQKKKKKRKDKKGKKGPAWLYSWYTSKRAPCEFIFLLTGELHRRMQKATASLPPCPHFGGALGPSRLKGSARGGVCCNERLVICMTWRSLSAALK